MKKLRSTVVGTANPQTSLDYSSIDLAQHPSIRDAGTEGFFTHTTSPGDVDLSGHLSIVSSNVPCICSKDKPQSKWIETLQRPAISVLLLSSMLPFSLQSKRRPNRFAIKDGWCRFLSATSLTALSSLGFFFTRAPTSSTLFLPEDQVVVLCCVVLC